MIIRQGIYKKIQQKDIRDIIEKNFSDFLPPWMEGVLEWTQNAYENFKDHNKHLIIIYLVNRALLFYKNKFSKIDMNIFFKKEFIEVEKINIIQISEDLRIPEESVRRKIKELQKDGFIKKHKKKVVMTRKAFKVMEDKKVILRTSRFLAFFSKFLENNKSLVKAEKTKDIHHNILNNFTYIWQSFYEMQIPLIVNWKNFFKDLETYQIWGVCTMNRIYHKQNNINKKTTINIDSYIHELAGSNNKILKTKGINAMTISDITQIPRTTVLRKLQKLIKMKFLVIDKYKLYHITSAGTEMISVKIVDKQKNLAVKFLAKFYNQLV